MKLEYTEEGLQMKRHVGREKKVKAMKKMSGCNANKVLRTGGGKKRSRIEA